MPGKAPTAGETAPVRPKSRTRQIRQIGALLIVLALVAFVVDNTDTVRIRFVFFHADLALIWVLIGTALLTLGAERLLLRRSGRRARASRQQPARPGTSGQSS